MQLGVSWPAGQVRHCGELRIGNILGNRNHQPRGICMYFGVDYYPEHWPEERWEIDAQLMELLILNVVPGSRVCFG